MPIVDWLITPFSYGFMQRGLAASLMVGVLCAIVGCYIVLRSMAFMGDALAHGILPGVAIAYLLQGSLIVGAAVAAVAVALGIGLLSRGGTLRDRHRHPLRGVAILGGPPHQHHPHLRR